MKKTVIFAIVFAGLAFASCKKERTCECTTTNTNTYTNASGVVTTNNSEPTTQTTVYKKIKKSDLGTICGDSKYNTSSTSSNSGASTTSNNTSETKCKIK